MEEDEPVSYERLAELVRAERRSNKLSVVPARFWPKVRDFLTAVTEEFRKEQHKDPWSRRTSMLSDEVKHAKEAAENLWTLRERKLAMLALARGRDQKTPDGITADESMLLDRFRQLLGEFRGRTFAGTVAGETAAPAVTVTPAQAASTQGPAGKSMASSAAGTHSPVTPTSATPGTVGAPAQPQSAVPPSPASPVESPRAPQTHSVIPPDAPSETMVTIRALGDIPPFVGPDMQTYLLKEGDIATVPPAIANLLEKRKKASIISTT